MQQKGDDVVLTNNDRQRAAGGEVAAEDGPSRPRRGRLNIAVIVMLSIVTLMVIALLLDLLTTPGLLRR
jgi:hypothetical protein